MIRNEDSSDLLKKENSIKSPIKYFSPFRKNTSKNYKTTSYKEKLLELMETRDKVSTISKTKEKTINANNSIKQSNKILFDKLYKQAKDLKDKINIKRLQLIENLRKKSVPNIHKTSKKIERKKDLFFERLYPYHKLAKNEKADRVYSESEKSFEYAHVATVRSNPLGISNEFDNEDFKNNIDNIFCDDDEIKNLYGNKPKFVKFYRGIKKNKSAKFPFKPSISKNSLEILEKNIEEKKASKSSLSSPNQKENKESSNEINAENSNKKIDQKIKILQNGESPDNKIKENIMKDTTNPMMNNLIKNYFKKESEEKNKIERNTSYIKSSIGNNSELEIIYNDYYNRKKDFFLYGKKLNEKSLKISDSIYTKGINMLKRKERLISEKAHADEEEINKISFHPNLNKKIEDLKFSVEKISKNNSFYWTKKRDSVDNKFNEKKKEKELYVIDDKRSDVKSFSIKPKKSKGEQVKNILLNSDKSNKPKKNNSSIDYSTNISNNNINTISKIENKVKSVSVQNLHLVKKDIGNLTVYERCKKWKENTEIKQNKIRDISLNEESKFCNFSPIITKNISNKIDDKFIKSEVKYIENYIKRRKNSIKSVENQKSYEDKIFGKSFEKSNRKIITQPHEFIFHSAKSRKSRLTPTKANFLHKAESVSEIRRELNTSNFFNESIVEIEDNNHNMHVGKINLSSIVSQQNQKAIEKNRKVLMDQIKKKNLLDKNKTGNGNLFINNENAKDMNINLNLNIKMK